MFKCKCNNYMSQETTGKDITGQEIVQMFQLLKQHLTATAEQDSLISCMETNYVSTDTVTERDTEAQSGDSQGTVNQCLWQGLDMFMIEW